MKFLIAGFGSIGRRHFQNLLSLGIHDILFLRSHRSTLPDDEIADYRVETDIHSALQHKPDAVIVSNPTSLHLDVAIPAAEMECHLLLEKPISHSMARVDVLQQAVKKGGSRVLVGYQFRFHPGLQKIEVLLGDQAIGIPTSVRAHWGEYLPGWHPWEDYRQGYSARSELGGGVTLTLSHPLDYLRWLLGEVESLWAFTGSQSGLGLNVEDTAEIGLKFDNGVIGSVHLNYIQQPPVHHLEIVGTHGTIRWDSSDGIVHVYQNKSKAWDFHPPCPGYSRNDLFIEEMKHFIQVVEGRCVPICSLQDGIRALDLALMALGLSSQ
jgi:predicted dehydrogenase